jgi:hypothetical protein
MSILHKLLGVRKSDGASAPSAQPAPPEPKRDRRISPRNPVRLPASMGVSVSGITEPIYVRDFNEKGVYLISNISVGIGAHVEIFLTMPPEMTGGEPREMHYIAAVVRVERTGKNAEYGVAAVIKRCELLPPARSKAVKSRRPQVHQAVSQKSGEVSTAPAQHDSANVNRD